MKRIILFATLLLCAFPFLAQESFFIQTETRYWDHSKTSDGYTLFGTGGKTYLIDFEGHVIHTWDIGTSPRFTEAGTLIDAAGGNPSGSTSWEELDWNGNVVWQYTETRSTYHPHHDFEKIYNPKLGDSTFIYIANKDLTSSQCLAAGCNASQNYTGAQMDAIVEVNRKGTVIWEWCFFNHVVQDLYPSITATYGVIANTPGRRNLNIPGMPVQKDWLHCNALDYNQSKDQIVISSVHGEFYVIDHGNTFIPNNPDSSIVLAASKKGDFLYRFGDPAKYNQGSAPSVGTNWETSTTGNKQIGGNHDVQWIKSGLPGAGDFLIFNNGQNLFELTGQSYIFEINPYLTSSGSTSTNYVNPPDAGYNVWAPANPQNFMKASKNISKQVVWKYSSKDNVSFMNTIGGSAQRLANGNTLVASCNDGHIFEVATDDSTIVWEYINPITSEGIKKVKGPTYPHDNSVFRAYRYLSTDPALVGHNLIAGSTITGFDPGYFTPADLTSITPTPSGIKNVPANSGNTLNENYPNPFANSTIITFEIPKSQQVSLVIYNLSGTQIKTLINKTYQPGQYSVSWDGTNDTGNHVPNGMYFYLLLADNNKICKKMIYNR